MDAPRPRSTDQQDVDQQDVDRDGGVVVVDAATDGGRSRFELRRGGELLSWATFRRQDGVVVIPHVETLVEHRGHGCADRLMGGIVDLARATGDHVMPLCSFAAGYLRDHPEHEGQVVWPDRA